jgi:chemotaxis protein MotB
MLALALMLGACQAPGPTRPTLAVRRTLERDQAALRGQLRDSGVAVLQAPDRVMVRVPAQLLFAADGTALNPAAAAARPLNAVAAALRADATVGARVAVYTDGIGGSAANQSLAQKRAEAVVAALTAAGVEASRLKADGAGAVAPLASDDTPEGRMQNRRVEISLLALGALAK